jgi:hypothetical protein
VVAEFVQEFEVRGAENVGDYTVWAAVFMNPVSLLFSRCTCGALGEHRQQRSQDLAPVYDQDHKQT